MFLTHDEAVVLKNDMDNMNFSNVDLIVCPSFLNFDVFKNYNLGAQNCHYENKGPYTGEVSAYDLNLRGVKYVIVGHSDRRKYDTLDEIKNKVLAILKNNMIPILCIGETKIDKELRRTSDILKKQLLTAIDKIDFQNENKIIIAYEPVWAIGGEQSLSKDEIEDTLKYIKKLLKQNNVLNYKILYGGSVNDKNICSILSNDIDGYLIGNASVDKKSLNNIIKCINSVNKDKI